MASWDKPATAPRSPPPPPTFRLLLRAAAAREADAAAKNAGSEARVVHVAHLAATPAASTCESQAAPASRAVDDTTVTVVPPSWIVKLPGELPSGWSCKCHGVGAHDVFFSYRVESEGECGNGLVKLLAEALDPSGGARQASPVKVFWDTRCLNLGESWEVGLHNGLEGTSLVVPLVSAKALERIIESAAQKTDNLLMEVRRTEGSVEL